MVNLLVLLIAFWNYPLPGTLEGEKREVLMWVGKWGKDKSLKIKVLYPVSVWKKVNVSSRQGSLPVLLILSFLTS